MSRPENWWNTWAPYWERMEDRHMGTALMEKILHLMAGPALVIGAGHGLIVEYLNEKGIPADGVDLDPVMVEQAKKRRGLDLTLADARELPYPDGRFKTVIVSTGVVDYADDEDAIAKMLEEAMRVVMPCGNLFVSFYQLHPVIERVYRRIGVIVDGTYHMERIFEIERRAKEKPISCVPRIREWTGRNVVSVTAHWFRLGFFLPKEIKREDKKIESILDAAQADGVSRETMLAAVPASIPYRTRDEVLRLAGRTLPEPAGVVRGEDALVLRYYNSCVTDEARRAAPMTQTVDDGAWHVRARGVSKRYPGSDADAVSSLSLSIETGSVFGLLGPNGAGKTTTLSILCGLMRPDAGTVEFANGMTPDAMRRRIGVVPQELALNRRLTARENLRFLGGLYGLSGEAVDERIENLLAVVGLADRADERANRYSSGMMRRLNLAAGLVHDPAILLLDEPTVGIDPQSRNCIFEMILRLKERGTTVLYTTHYMEEARRLCDRVAILDHGRIILAGEPGELVRDYGVTRIDFAAADVPDEFAERLRAIDGVAAAYADRGTLSVLTREHGSAMDVLTRIHRLADEDGAALSLRGIVEPNLESVFLDFTGRHLRDEGAA